MNGITGYIDDICISLEVAARIFSRYDSTVIAAFLSSDGSNINRIDVSEINGRSALGIDAAVVIDLFVLSGIDDADELAFALNIKGLIVKNKCFRRVGVIAAIVDPTHITLSTDGHGSVPRFNEKGEMVGLGVGGVDGNLKETIRLISDCKMPIEQALLFTTKNVGDALGFKDQGRVEVGACANACLFTEDFNLTHVVARGRVMMRDGEVVVKGTFEI